MNKTILFHAFLVGCTLLAFSCTIRENGGDGAGIIDETESVLTGRVLDPDGNPVSNAIVSIYGDSVDLAGTATLSKVSEFTQPNFNRVETITDKDGYYRIHGNHFGKTYLLIEKGDEFGYLDSVELKAGEVDDLSEITLLRKGNLKIDTENLIDGNQIWIPQLGLLLDASNTTIIVSTPPGKITIIIITANGNTSLPPVDVEEDEDEVVVPPPPSSSSVEASSSSEAPSSSSISPVSMCGTQSYDPITTLCDDRDSQLYNIVQIGTQRWLQKGMNLGTMVTTTNVLLAPGQKHCSDNSEALCDDYGALYQWHIAMDLPDTCASKSCQALVQAKHRGICPSGWHMPGPADWDALGAELGGMSVAGTKMKLANTGAVAWDNAYNDGNSSGFSVYPLGVRYFNGTFLYSLSHPRTSDNAMSGSMWEAIELNSDPNNAYFRTPDNTRAPLNRDSNHLKKDSFAARCVED